MHMVGEFGASSSRATKSVEKIGDYDLEGESQTLIGAIGTTAATIDVTPTEGTTTEVMKDLMEHHGSDGLSLLPLVRSNFGSLLVKGDDKGDGPSGM
ncbi:hypothetical protein HAX54_016980 [Datura stramonium]|uniref:Uncharacterized protein n=1 Tax=Datura stramonium TaxID=4076 RepID=A0ABS8UM44_DATST|nr:hypothetical protein [Datura stramonium]